MKNFSNSPSAFVLVSAVALGDIQVDVDGREFHVVLVLKGVGRIAGITGEVDSVAFGTRRNGERLVVCIPRIVLQIRDDNSQLRAVVARQMMQLLISNPKLTIWIAKTIRVFFP